MLVKFFFRRRFELEANIFWLFNHHLFHIVYIGIIWNIKMEEKKKKKIAIASNMNDFPIISNFTLYTVNEFLMEIRHIEALNYHELHFKIFAYLCHGT